MIVATQTAPCGCCIDAIDTTTSEGVRVRLVGMGRCSAHTAHRESTPPWGHHPVPGVIPGICPRDILVDACAVGAYLKREPDVFTEAGEVVGVYAHLGEAPR